MLWVNSCTALVGCERISRRCWHKSLQGTGGPVNHTTAVARQVLHQHSDHNLLAAVTVRLHSASICASIPLACPIMFPAFLQARCIPHCLSHTMHLPACSSATARTFPSPAVCCTLGDEGRDCPQGIHLVRHPSLPCDPCDEETDPKVEVTRGAGTHLCSSADEGVFGAEAMRWNGNVDERHEVIRREGWHTPHVYLFAGLWGV